MEILTNSIILAQAAAPAAAAQPPSAGLGMFMPMILMMAAFWFLIIGPQRRKQKAHERMLANLGTGAKVLTTGGVYGTVTNVKSDRFIVKIADSVKIEVAKANIVECFNEDEAVASEDAAVEK